MPRDKGILRFEKTLEGELLLSKRAIHTSTDLANGPFNISQF